MKKMNAMMKRATKKIQLLLALTMVLSCCSISALAATYYVSRIQEGDYYLCASSNQNYAISVKDSLTTKGTYFHLWERIDGNPDQIFHIEHLYGDWYRIKVKSTDLCMNVSNGINQNGQRLWTWPWDGTDSCVFRFADAGNGTYVIQNRMGRCIDLDNNLIFNGSRIHLWQLHSGASEKWVLKPVQKSVSNTYQQKVNEFLNDARFKNGTAWGGSQKPKLSSYNGESCCAYTADFVRYVFGKDDPRSGVKFYRCDEIRAGDVLYTNRPHWLVVISRDGSRLTTAEGNWEGRVVVSSTTYTIQNEQLYRDGKVFNALVTGYHYQ